MCVPEACNVRVTVAAILKEKLTLKSPGEVDTAVWNPDIGRTPVRTNSENASERLYTANSRAWGRGNGTQCFEPGSQRQLGQQVSPG